ncbi:MAG: hypothetical protein Q4G26_09470 [Paracoccus sp. (in: a-proteobacteria)]|nr:hypothetical protein [Paracoccus sp. (in: a-proteobacteria)]
MLATQTARTRHHGSLLSRPKLVKVAKALGNIVPHLMRAGADQGSGSCWFQNYLSFCVDIFLFRRVSVLPEAAFSRLLSDGKLCDSNTSMFRLDGEGRDLKFKRHTLEQISDMVCGNFESDTSVFRYRSSSHLTEFFADADTDYVHDSSTRKWWVAGTLETILAEPSSDPRSPPDSFLRVIAMLMDQGDAQNEGAERPKALEMLNAALSRESFEAFYGDDRICYLRIPRRA